MKQELFEHPERFEFFAAARILCLIAGKSPEGPSERRSGDDVTFRAAPTRSFPAGEVQKLEQEGGLLKLYSHVIGLFGPTGVLPHHDKDMVVGGEPNLLMRDFLDIFNARVTAQFFKAWQTNRHDIGLEMHRCGVSRNEDSATMALMSLCGLGIPSTREQYLFSDDVFAGTCGLLSRPVRSVSSLRRCIAKQFQLPVQVVEFVEEQLHLPRRIQSRLASDGLGHNQLAKSVILGASVTAHRQRFEVRLGPLERDDFRALCPYGDAAGADATVPTNITFRRLVDLIRATLSRPLDFDIRLVASQEAVTPGCLGSTRLGYDSWVLSKPSKKNRHDTLKRFNWETSGH